MEGFILQDSEFNDIHSYIHSKTHDMLQSVWWLEEMMDDITDTRYVIHYVAASFNPVDIPCKRK